MGIIKRLEASIPARHRARTRAGMGYAAAEFSRLTASLLSESQYINTTLRYQLRTLRARSRQASQNNPFGKRFVQMVADNVFGPMPFRLQAKAKFKNGRLDTSANDKIETAFRRWGVVGECEITGRWSWNTTQRLIGRILPTDGEVLIRKIEGGDTRFGYQLQLIDVDRLDEQKNQKLSNGSVINMGVEMDAVSRPLAYHVLKRKPVSWDRGYVREYERIPADEIFHLFVPDFAEQARGVPWMYAALLNLVHLGAFEEAAVIAARVGASKMGFFTSPDGDPSAMADSKDGNTGDFYDEVDPGQFGTLPPGYGFTGYDPKYPDAAVEPFIKACLRGVSAGLGVSYHNLANDLEGVNYSSARIGELSERDMWKGLQTFIVDHLHQPLYEDWLPIQVIRGNIALPLSAGGALALDKYRDVTWQPKRWAWTDPLKEVNANILAIDNRLKSRTRVIAEQGEDVEDVLEELAQEEQMAKDKNLSLAKPVTTAPANGGGKPNGDMPNDDEDKPDGEEAEKD